MVWLNYQHLFYFWTVVRKGSVVEACRVLRLAPSTVSAQIHMLESNLGKKLLIRSGRNLQPTEMGMLVLGYADSIFALGNELLQKIHENSPSGTRELRVGVAYALPKAVARWLMEPALHLPEKVHVVCRESSCEKLLQQLSSGELDVVLADAPAAGLASQHVSSHLILESGVSFVANSKLAVVYKKDFPRSLHGAPFLLPMTGTSLRHELDSWFDSEKIQPDVVGEFENHGMLRAFTESEVGIVPVASCVADQFLTGRGVKKVGETGGVRVRYYAISTRKSLEYPPVAAICQRTGVVSAVGNNPRATLPASQNSRH